MYDLYDITVCTPFSKPDSNSTSNQEHLSTEREELSELLSSLRSVFNDAIDEFQEYCNSVAFMKEEYATPLHRHFLNNPGACIERWKEGQLKLKREIERNEMARLRRLGGGNAQI